MSLKHLPQQSLPLNTANSESSSLENPQPLCCPQKPNSAVAVVPAGRSAASQGSAAHSLRWVLGTGRAQPRLQPLLGTPSVSADPARAALCQGKGAFLSICLLNKPPGAAVGCGSSLLMSQSLWSHDAAEGSALGNESCCRFLPSGWFSSLSTCEFSLEGPILLPHLMTQSRIPSLSSLPGELCLLTSVPSFTPKLCFLRSP